MEAGIIRTVVLREDATYDIFVELDAKGVRDLLGDAQVAEFGVAPFHLQDCRDEFWGRPFGAGLAAPCRRGKERPIFSIYQRSVESEQRCGFDERAKLRDALGTYQ